MKKHRHTSPDRTSPTFRPFRQRLINALTDLKRRLQSHYEDLNPDHHELVREIVAEAEATAWDLSPFPHLVLPDLVELRMEELALQPAFARSDDAATFAYAA